MPPELDDSGRPLTPEGVAAWWRRWGLDHETARKQRAVAYARQKAEAKEVMSGIPPPRTDPA